MSVLLGFTAPTAGSVRVGRTPGDGRPRRPVLLSLDRHDRRDRRLDLHRPVSKRDGLEHQRHYNLTVNNVASGHYALVVMTVVAVIFFPLVLLYQGWSFHVFRARLKAPPDHADLPSGPEQATPQAG